MLFKAVHHFPQERDVQPYGVLLLQHLISRRRLPPDLRCKQVYPAEGKQCSSLWDAPSPDVLLRWLNAYMAVGHRNRHEVFLVKEDAPAPAPVDTDTPAALPTATAIVRLAGATAKVDEEPSAVRRSFARVQEVAAPSVTPPVSARKPPRGVTLAACGPPPTNLTLPTLPVKALAPICKLLTTKERMAVTSCCSTLWNRADVTSSEEIWGDVEAHWRGADAEADAAATLGRTRGRMAGLLARRQQQTQAQQPLVPWLARRRAGLRRVSLSLSGEVDLAEVERALSGAQLTHLSLKFGSSCRLPRLPPALAALAPTLAELDCSGNNHVGLRQDTSLQALGVLGGLSRLALSNCGLRAVPHQLSVLRRLADLDLSQNPEMREGEEQLRHVAGTLTQLNISGSALQPARLAAQLGRFSALRALCLDADRHFGQETRDASPWLQLQDKLGGLKQLRLGGRLVRRLPTQLCVFGAVEDLCLDHAMDLQRDGDGGMQPIRHLTRVTRLSMQFCCMGPGLPPQLSALKDLVTLDFSNNNRLGYAAGDDPNAFQPLQHLRALTRLDFAESGLESVPPQLAHCTRLLHLDLSGSKNVFQFWGESAFEPLLHLRALTYLNLSSCRLPRLPNQLSACTALLDLSVGNNTGLGARCSESFRLLIHLRGLTRLSIARCTLLSVPQHIGLLSNLAELDMQGNPASAQGWTDAAMEPLRHLHSLRELDASGCGFPGQKYFSPPPLVLALVGKGLTLKR